ncbi:hypothetical protein IA57_11970 [Mangrovimonas yunxiaonensis]|uniref:DUF1835 domain-containing protein n=1 Tax=Mangrovimonas yunxiaonensis TaxID=1197477 RepID=A0A084THF7_9FLAO|nr:hypothetical protein [Mangrovimonas yunxiaonensis]KFB00143.1 hypothetical protein IA57_11970 [Mangrovimonas yunxiaonensis]GGH42123.1 hypothetical protein GCM10011364_13440 [Mangrovimonas yunxiaonensis]
MKTLHITNGSVLTHILEELNITGDVLTWNEMLCEGQTEAHIGTEAYLSCREQFFKQAYDLEFNTKEFLDDISKLNTPENYNEVVLWFEYDLFCHINMFAAISLLKQKQADHLPIYLVCSGHVKGETGLKGLGELTPDQLKQHFKARVKLNKTDLDTANTLWEIYCGKDHNLFVPFIAKTTSFSYLSNCLKAHLQRFPHMGSGLSSIERNILMLVNKHHIKSKHHLLGYALNYQGYYGYGDMQLERLINVLAIFFDQGDTALKLNRKGHDALMGQHNFASEINNAMHYGGVNRLDYQYYSTENKLYKTISHGN